MRPLRIAALAFALGVASADAIASPCEPGFCFSAEGCVVSEAGVDCVECDGKGYLVGSVCACYASARPLGADCSPSTVLDPYVTSSICDLERGECEIDDGTCGTSRYGSACAECRGEGYVEPTVVDGAYRAFRCACYTPSKFSWTTRCSPFSAPPANETLVATQTIAILTSHSSRSLGFFVAVPPAPYGPDDPSPPVPRRCLPGFGPPVDSVIATNFEECNSYFAVDPSTGVEARCAGHGTWNAGTYRCECYDGWKLGPSGYFDADGNATFVCSSCLCLRGPPAGSNSAGLADCSAPWTPNVAGDDATCGGNGDFLGGACACYSNDEDGRWSLADVAEACALDDADGVGYVVNVTVATCSICEYGYGPETAAAAGARPCTRVFATPSPVESPTTAPAYLPAVRLFAVATAGVFPWDDSLCVGGGGEAGSTALVVDANGVALADLPEYYVFSRLANVRGGSFEGPLVAANWTAFAEGALVSSLADAGVVQEPYWVGGCDSFTNSSALGLARFANVTTDATTYSFECAVELAVLCVEWPQ